MVTKDHMIEMPNGEPVKANASCAGADSSYKSKASELYISSESILKLIDPVDAY